ncbi:hypothetical protein B0A49_11452 [Cryomyces minteri]|uniref:IMP-specific 5'-nucleotidase 1 n=1 Tax=Cryomyces minteri TaxID=331657 RepID=A0A4U0VH36_9PEZI|nr:hypothetical protein B0A49_11452 [Cryomyces minteri]
MTTRYRVEYALKAEWIKGLLAVPFVLLSQPTAVFEEGRGTVIYMAQKAHKRYGEIMEDVEELINDHSGHSVILSLLEQQLIWPVAHQTAGTHDRSKLKLLVPSISVFYTPLLLHEAFRYQDARRHISFRRFVPPSFNDIRLILNTAQVMSLVKDGPLELVTFDGDVTLYDDGESLTAENPVIPFIIRLMLSGTKIGIVTAAGYTDAARYYGRLHGLLDAIHASDMPRRYKKNLVVIGGESSYLFKSTGIQPDMLCYVPRQAWQLEEMRAWRDEDVVELLDVAERALRDCISNMRLRAEILRKERAVGLIPKTAGYKFAREELEETVLVTQKILEMSAVGKRLPFCGNDVFVDIGDKSWGVLACQRFFGGIEGGKTLHVGDQFLSAGANDFKARLACTTAWIASPAETVDLLGDIADLDWQIAGRKIGDART